MSKYPLAVYDFTKFCLGPLALSKLIVLEIGINFFFFYEKFFKNWFFHTMDGYK